MAGKAKPVWAYVRASRERARRTMGQAGESINCHMCGRRFVRRPGLGGQVNWRVWHHINGNPFDNRPRNLVALCRVCHNVLHLFVSGRHIVRSSNWTGLRYVARPRRVRIPYSDWFPYGRSRKFMALAEALRGWARQQARRRTTLMSDNQELIVRVERSWALRMIERAIRWAALQERVILGRYLKELGR